MYLFVFLCFRCVLCVYVVSFLSDFLPFLCLTLDGLFSFEILQSWVRLSQILWCALFHNADSMCYSSKTTRPLKELCAAASSPFTRKGIRFRFVQFPPPHFSVASRVSNALSRATHALELVSNFLNRPLTCVTTCCGSRAVSARSAVLLVSCCLSESNWNTYISCWFEFEKCVVVRFHSQSPADSCWKLRITKQDSPRVCTYVPKWGQTWGFGKAGYWK